MSVDTAELLAGFEHPGGAPAQRHLSVAPVLDVSGVVPAYQIMDSIALVERSVRARVGGTPSRSTVSVSSSPSRRLAAAPGWVVSSARARVSSCAAASSAESAW